MYSIDPNLYATNGFYRDYIEKMLSLEQRQKQLQIEQNRLKAETEAYYRQQAIGYVNQIPYSCMTPVSPNRWSAPYNTMQDNFVSYWSQTNCASGHTFIAPQQNRAGQPERLRQIFHTAADMSALACKQNNPVASIILDGIGLLTAGNLLEATWSAVSMIDTAMDLSKK